jgi:phosphoribosylformylglycinamidine (FGAM) synthase-like enzyme
MSDACRAFEVPVISGNVSFYNESFGSPIYPTPTVGLVGVLQDASKRMTMHFKNAGDVVVLLGETADELGGSEYLSTVHGVIAGVPPAMDVVEERAIHEALLAAIEAGLVRSAHDCSEGGVAVALAECAIAGGLGATVTLDDDLAPVSSLFSETQGRIVVTCAEADAEALTDLFVARSVAFSVIGEVGGDRLVIEDMVDVSLQELEAAWKPTLERLVQGEMQSEELREG